MFETDEKVATEAKQSPKKPKTLEGQIIVEEDKSKIQHFNPFFNL